MCPDFYWVDQEHGGIIRHGANCFMPLLKQQFQRRLITRKAYGGAYCVMNSKHLKADFNLRGLRLKLRSWAGRDAGQHHPPKGDRFGRIARKKENRTPVCL